MNNILNSKSILMSSKYRKSSYLKFIMLSAIFMFFISINMKSMPIIKLIKKDSICRTLLQHNNYYDRQHILFKK